MSQNDNTAPVNVYSPENINYSSFTTGIIEGLELALSSPDNTKVDVLPGKMMFADTYTDPLNPQFKIVEVTNTLTFDPQLDRRSKWCWLELDVSDNIVFRAEGAFEVSDTRGGVILGKVRDANSGPQVTVVDDFPFPCYNTSYSSRDSLLSVGSFGIRNNEVSVNAVNPLQLDIAAGISFRPFSDIRNGNLSPHVRNDNAQIPRTSYAYHTQGTDVTTSYPQIQTTVWDNNGVIEPIPLNSNWIVQRVQFFPKTGSVHIVHGQKLYANFDDAKAGVADSVNLNEETLYGSYTRGFLIIKDGAIDLGNPTESLIINVPIGAGKI